MTVPLEKLLAAARNAPRRSFPDHDCKLDSKIEYLLEGTWDVTDLIEMQVDEEAVAEISTTAAAGSGTERPFLMEAVLIEPLARFRKRFAGIRIEAVVDNRMLSLTRREADVAVRPTAAPPETLVGRRVASVATAVYGSRERRDLSAEGGPAELASRDWIAWEDGVGGSTMIAWTARHVPDENCVYRTNSMLQQFLACRAGLGLAILPCFLGDGDSGLVRLLTLEPDKQTGLWLLTHRDLRRTARVRALLDFLHDELRRLRPRFEGEAA